MSAHADDHVALAAWAEIYAHPEFHRQMREVARKPHESIADEGLDRKVERFGEKTSGRAPAPSDR